MTPHVRLAIIGSGPGGLSAAVTAARLGVPHVLFERTDHLADTIHKYQKGKKVMAHPMRLPLLGTVRFDEGRREEILQNWAQAAQDSRATIQFNTEITRITRQGAGFAVAAAGGDAVTADAVVLAIGLQGNLRRLDIPGGQSPIVRYQLDDPDEFRNQRIVVIGAGDAGIENALALCTHNAVSIINRQPDFSKAKPGNAADAERAVRAGRLTAFHGASPARIEDGLLVIDTPSGETTLPVDLVIARLGAIPPRRFIESCGIEFPSRTWRPFRNCPNITKVMCPGFM